MGIHKVTGDTKDFTTVGLQTPIQALLRAAFNIHVHWELCNI